MTRGTVIAIAIAAFLFGTIVGGRFGARYEFKTWQHLPLRVDKWTGRAEVVIPQQITRP